MDTGARGSADPALVHAIARAKTAARAALPVEPIANDASGVPASRGATARGDALEGTLARAVSQRGGDSAVALHVVGATLQREMAITASDLDKEISTSKALKANFGLAKSTRLFTAIRDGVADYQHAAKKGKSSAAARARQLEVLEALCARFLKTHRSDKRAARDGIVDKLWIEINKEQMALTRSQAQDIYQGNVESSKKQVSATETDPGKKFGFKALTSDGKKVALDHKRAIDPGNKGPDREARIATLMHDKGVSKAEISAISIFSTGDFVYINPVTVNSKSWLEEQKSSNADDAWTQMAPVKNSRYRGATGGPLEGHQRSDGWWIGADQELKEEGSLHTAVALQGLLKIDPYLKEVYRGSRFTEKDWGDKGLQAGKTFAFGSLTSSSKDKDRALDFLYGLNSGSVGSIESSCSKPG